MKIIRKRKPDDISTGRKFKLVKKAKSHKLSPTQRIKKGRKLFV